MNLDLLFVPRFRPCQAVLFFTTVMLIPSQKPYLLFSW